MASHEKFIGGPPQKETKEILPDLSPIRNYVIKVHERCNLACRYCYMYFLADQTWRNRAYMMPEATFRKTTERIGEHLDPFPFARINIVLHGGEPLLLGPTRIGKYAEIIKENISYPKRVSIFTQTNGTLLDEPMLEMLAENNIFVGVSLDGTKSTNDRQRIYSNGRGSYDEVAAGLNLLRTKSPQIYAGILSTIDIPSNPLETYESLLAFQPPTIDLLLPHGNWTNPPPGRDLQDTQTPYADWLIPIYDRWHQTPQPKTQIRLFEQISNLAWGEERSRVFPEIVIESDGAIEQVDSLKSTYEGAAATGYNVLDHSFSQALDHPGMHKQYDDEGHKGLSQTCKDCSLVNVCNGGIYAHRWKKENDFDNPSVYCPDLTKLITHIRMSLLIDR